MRGVPGRRAFFAIGNGGALAAEIPDARLVRLDRVGHRLPAHAVPVVADELLAHSEVSGEGDPLVLLHGGFVGASSFFAQVPALVEAGYRVHVPERRGTHTPRMSRVR